eukprot:CAMPEP_0178601654 /NCGR_PEP_ID=MMETSP0697-20121206/34509_1 /TAXON_ID=265572 /ORGANISM="Extubocellulus spinifer, Strain CCMP396" /LENGTH=1415 /DNA_ID=CAMNT_0020239739 /DNA_START=565 /DNA_END=4812 /DNA_ORIENTATION=+
MTTSRQQQPRRSSGHHAIVTPNPNVELIGGPGGHAAAAGGAGGLLPSPPSLGSGGVANTGTGKQQQQPLISARRHLDMEGEADRGHGSRPGDGFILNKNTLATAADGSGSSTLVVMSDEAMSDAEAGGTVDSGSPGRGGNEVTPDHTLYTSRSGSGSAPSSNGTTTSNSTNTSSSSSSSSTDSGPSPQGRTSKTTTTMAGPSSSGQPTTQGTPPRAPPPASSSFLRPRGTHGRPLQGRILFGPSGIGGTGTGAGAVVPAPPPSNRMPSVQQLKNQLQQQPQQQLPSPYSDRGRKRRAYSANGPLSSSLLSSRGSATTAGGASSAPPPSSSSHASSSWSPSPSTMGPAYDADADAAIGLFISRDREREDFAAATTTTITTTMTLTPTPPHHHNRHPPHHLSPSNIGLESMSLRSPGGRPGCISETGVAARISAGAGTVARGTDPSRRVRSGAATPTQFLCTVAKGTDPSRRVRSGAATPTHGASATAGAVAKGTDPSRRVRSGAATPTQFLQTSQSSPPGRRSIRVPCPQFSSSSAFGSVGTADNGGGGGGSSSVGSCFGPLRSRTPSPNDDVLLPGRHRRGGSTASGIFSAVSATGNPPDVSVDSSAANTTEDAGMFYRGHGSLSSPSQLRMGSPRHVPLMVLTTSASEDGTDEEAAPPSGQKVLTQEFDLLEERHVSHRSRRDYVEPKVEQFLFEASVVPAAIAELSTPTVPPVTVESPVVSSSVASPSASSPAVSGGGFGRFGLSPRKPLPSRVVQPTKLLQSPMIKSSHDASPRAPTPTRPARVARPLLSPRRTAKDGKLSDLLFGNDDPCSANAHDRSPPTSSTSKPPPLPGQDHDAADMGAVMDGLLMGFANGRSLVKQKDRFESSNSLAFSMASSTTSSDKARTYGADHSFPIKSLSFGGNDDERKMPAEAGGADCSPRHPSSSPLSSNQATPVRNASSGNIGFELPQGFKARSVLTPSKSGASLQRLLEADRHMREKADGEDLDNGSLSDSCDDSRGPKDMFFLNSPEAVTAESIQAAEVENIGGRDPEDEDALVNGPERKKRSVGESSPLMPMVVSETCTSTNNGQAQAAPAEGGRTSSGTASHAFSSSSSTVESRTGGGDQIKNSSSGHRKPSINSNLRKQRNRSVTFSPAPEVSLRRSASLQREHRLLTQTSSSSLYGMDIVQEESSAQDGKESGHTAEAAAASAVTPGPHQSTDQENAACLFPAIPSKLRIESSDSLSITGGSHYSLQQYSKRQSFGSSGSLLAHFNNLNKQEADLSLNFGSPSDAGSTRMQRPSSRESALGLPIGQDDDETVGRPPSRALMYTPPARDLITPPAQTFSIGSSVNPGVPPPIASRRRSNDSGSCDEMEDDGITSSNGSAVGRSHETRIHGRKALCVASADKDSVKLAIARMAMEADKGDSRKLP